MWQRFTERARIVVLQGQNEAARMQSGYVGTEHLLLGLVQENEGVTALIFQTMGITSATVQAEIEKEAQPAESSPSSEAKLTPSAKRVLELASDEAQQMGHDYIGSEHLLIALLREKDKLAAVVLRRLGLNIKKARSLVMGYVSSANVPEAVPQSATQSQETPASEPPLTAIPIEVIEIFNRLFTPEATALLNRATLECSKAAEAKISVNHLILALLSDENAAVLRRKLSGR